MGIGKNTAPKGTMDSASSSENKYEDEKHSAAFFPMPVRDSAAAFPYEAWWQTHSQLVSTSKYRSHVVLPFDRRSRNPPTRGNNLSTSTLSNTRRILSVSMRLPLILANPAEHRLKLLGLRLR
eukprot:g28585.t1